MVEQPQRIITLSHAFLGVSYATVSEERGKMPRIIRLKTDGAKEEFLFRGLREGDKLYLELGGAGDKIAPLANFRGVEVHRIPIHRLSGELGAERLSGELGAEDAAAHEGEATSTCFMDLVRQRVEAKWDRLIPYEHSVGGETTGALTGRKLRALCLNILAEEEPALFYPVGQQEMDVLLLKDAFRRYRALQKTLLGSYLRLLGTMNDRYLLEAARNKIEPFVGKRVNVEAAKATLTAMMSVIPEAEREAFAKRMGVDSLEGKKAIPRTRLRKLFHDMIEALVESGASMYLLEMKNTKREMEKLLKRIAVWGDVFSDIPGCGPLIASRMISAIVDIRRFPTLPTLKAFAGYHHFPDGSRARRVKGRVSNWNPELKQAVFLWTQQTLKMKGSPWRARLDQRRAYELLKLLDARQKMATSEGLEHDDILPREYAGRTILSTNEMTLEDLAKLTAHVDILRKRAGVAVVVAEEDEEAEDEENGDEAGGGEEHEESEDAAAVRDQKLTKLVRGLKMRALQKAQRWLGQQLLKHVYKRWRSSLGMPELPVKDASRPRLENAMM